MEKEYCTCCCKLLLKGKITWLELDARVGKYTAQDVPEQFSQGAFAFGKTCASKATK